MRTWLARMRGSIGARVAVAVLVLFLAALILSGLMLYSLSRASIERRVQNDLSLISTDLRTLASNGTDPETGRPFASSSALLKEFIGRSAISQHQGELALVNGELAWLAPTTIPLRLEKDDAFMSAARTTASNGMTAQGTVSSGRRDYRYIVVPVSFGPSDNGVLIRAVDIAPEFRDLNAIFRNYIIVGVLSLILVAAVIMLLMGQLLAPLKLVRQTAEDLSENDLSGRIPVVGDDALTSLTGTINDMLDRLEHAVTNQRQLVSDVSHELKTPLTIMRGNLELLNPEKPGQVAATKRTLLDVTDRMDRLVNDLLTLAHAEQPDFLRREPTDIADLTATVADLAESLDERPWIVDHFAEIVLDIDPQRILQAWLQLASNAVKYSFPGTTITIGSRVDNDRVLCYVIDRGPGIAPADQAMILERFTRTESARMTNTPGSGLGLAIVASIARAHGGEVLVTSRMGVGSTISISIPTGGGHEQHPDR